MNFKDDILNELSTKIKSDRFSIYVEEQALKMNAGIIETLSAIVEENSLDYEAVKHIISPTLLDKIKKEHFRKEETNTLF